MPVDARRNAWRSDLADERLEGKVEAAHFARGEEQEIARASTPVRREPRPAAMRVTEALLGEPVLVFERRGGWAWVQLVDDGYVGYVVAEALRPPALAATHRVAVPLTHRFPEANMKSEPARPLYLGGRVRVEDETGGWAKLADGGYVYARHLRGVLSTEPDAASVAQKFLGVPYLWGGKTFAGLDCSGLVQVALNAAGITCPRDSDMMETELGAPVSLNGPLRRGDLIFWKGHVGIMLDGERLLHANAHHMLTVIEPIETARARIAGLAGPMTSIKRFSQ